MREYFVFGTKGMIRLENKIISKQLDEIKELKYGLRINTYISGLNLSVAEISDNGNRISLLMNY